MKAGDSAEDYSYGILNKKIAIWIDMKAGDSAEDYRKTDRYLFFAEKTTPIMKYVTKIFLLGGSIIC